MQNRNHYLSLKPDVHMANVDVYNSIAIAAGVSPNRQMRVTNYGRVLCLMEESQKGHVFLWLTIRQMHELAL